MYTIQIREVRTGEISFETLEEAKQWHENREGDVYWYYNDDINFGTNNCTEINNDSLYKDDFNFSSIEEYDCPIIESLKETL